MMTEERVLQQLQVGYDDIRHNYSKISTIQNWCLTVWLATLALVSGPQLKFSFVQRAILPLLPILVFWVLTGLQYMFIIIQIQRAEALERALSEGISHLLAPEEVFFYLSYHRMGFSQKFRLLIHALFLKEMVTSFY